MFIINTVFFIAIVSAYHANGAILLWSNRKFEISPLRDFTEENFEELVEELGYPEVTIYKTAPSLLPEFREYLKGYHKAYNPSGDVNTENATEISDQDDFVQLERKLQIDSAQDGNILSVLVIPNGRNKREVIASSTTTEVIDKTLKGPVFYKGESKVDKKMTKKIYGLLYSSEPLLLKTNSSSLLLGRTSADMILVDTDKNSYTRLNVKIPLEEEFNLLFLRFLFSWSNNGYWSLISVKISDTNGIYNFNLTTSEKISAPARFSYHCNGETVFSYSNGSNNSNNVELYIYDMQVQINSPDGKFGDAYDCVNFTTGPILSGLFVAVILAIGLIIGLVGISEIKTMDKFDNQKTKQLVITVSE